MHLNRKSRRTVISGLLAISSAASLVVQVSAATAVAPVRKPQPGAKATGSKAFIRPASTTPIGDKWAVVIGISKFADSRVPTLKYAAKDAQDFYDFLVDPAKGNFRKDHVKLLLNNQASKINIMDMLGDSFLPHAANPDDLVVIYLSTHGSPSGADIRGVNYVIAHDTHTKRLFATGIEMRQLLSMIKERVHTNRILLVLDTCYSGAGSSEHKGLMRVNIDSQRMSQGIGSLVICSSSPDQLSWESDDLKNSYFTRYLIDEWKNPNNTPIEQVFGAMKQKVQQTVLKDKGEVQTPVMSGTFSGPKLVIGVPPSTVREAPITVPVGDSDVAAEGRGKSAVDFTAYGEFMRKAHELIAANKLWDASHELEAAIKSNPDSVEAQLVAADVYDAQGRYAEALEAAKHAVRNDDDSSQAHERLARAYMRTSVPEEALRQAQRSVTIDPENSMGHFLLGKVNERAFNRIDLAEQQYRKALELNSLNGPALLGMANLLQRQGKDAEQVESLIKKALEADENDAEARLAMGRIHLEKKQVEAAEKEIRKAIEYDPNNPVLHAELGNIISLYPDKAADAEIEYRKAIELGPKVGYCHAVFATCLLQRRGRVEESEKEYRLAIKLDPELDDARVKLGDMLVKYKKQYDEADDLYRKAFLTNPRNAFALVGLANIKSDLYKDYAASEAEFKKALTLDPKLSSAHDQLGYLYEKNMNRLAEAKQSYTKAIETDSKNASAHYHLAMLMLKQMKPKDTGAAAGAMAEMQKAVELAPGVSLYRTKLGWIKSTQFKNYKDAEADFRKAIETNLSDAEAHFRLGMLLIERLGQRKAGEEELRTAIAQNPSDPEIKAAYERFAH